MQPVLLHYLSVKQVDRQHLQSTRNSEFEYGGKYDSEYEESEEDSCPSHVKVDYEC